MTAPFLKPIPRLRCTRIACAGGLLLCLLGQDASAADVLVVTDSRHPVQSASGARVTGKPSAIQRAVPPATEARFV